MKILLHVADSSHKSQLVYQSYHRKLVSSDLDKISGRKLHTKVTVTPFSHLSNLLLPAAMGTDLQWWPTLSTLQSGRHLLLPTRLSPAERTEEARERTEEASGQTGEEGEGDQGERDGQ